MTWRLSQKTPRQAPRAQQAGKTPVKFASHSQKTGRRRQAIDHDPKQQVRIVVLDRSYVNEHQRQNSVNDTKARQAGRFTHID